jgi:hypothetical protein
LTNLHRNPAISAAAFVVAGMILSLATSRPSNAQSSTQAAQPSAQFSALAKLPDWSGAWVADPRPSVLVTNERIPLAAKYATELADLRAKAKAGAPPPGNPQCRPEGMPLFMSQKGPLYEFLYAPGHIFIDAENQEKRDIHTDGRTLKDPDFDSFAGEAVGTWKGDTLNVESRGFLPYVELFPGVPADGDYHVSEQIRLVGPNKLQDDITLSGDQFTAPYHYTVTFTRHREWAVAEYICLVPSHANYHIAGYKITDAEEKASSQDKPPTRQPAQPAPNAASLKGGTWASIATLPDWFGPWQFDNRRNEAITREYIPLSKPYADYREEAYEYVQAHGDEVSDVYHCRPRGAAQEMKAAGNGFYLVYTPGQVTLEQNGAQTRRFYTDGRAHPANLELSFNGHSTAHWEGDTLVAETVGLRKDVQMYYSMPSGGQLRLVERIHLTAPNKLEFDVTQYSPVSLVSPWAYNRTFTRKPDWNMLEDYCTQNNRDVDPVSGLQTFDLTPPPQ